MDPRKKSVLVKVSRKIGHRKGFIPPRRIGESEENREAEHRSPTPKKKRDLSPLFEKIVNALEEKPDSTTGDENKSDEVLKVVDSNQSTEELLVHPPPASSQQEGSSNSSGDSWFDKAWNNRFENEQEDKDVEMLEEDEKKLDSGTPSSTRPVFKRPIAKGSGAGDETGNEENLISGCQREATGSQSQSLTQSQTYSGDVKFYNAVFAKASTRKHKRFEDDGFIVVSNGTRIALKNVSGKTIESSQNYKITPEILEDGKVFKLGGKEVQILDQLPCNPFAADLKPPPPDAAAIKACAKLPAPIANRPFVSPCNPEMLSTSEKPNKNVAKSMFDPEAPDALVMPVLDPNEDVPVVVDPHLSRHLREHQREGVTFLYKCVMGKYHNGAILGDEMGLGKTLQCITLLWTLIKQGPFQRKEIVKRALIIAPSSLVSNWEKEFQRWLGLERIRVFAVNSDRPMKHYPPQCPVIIMSYEMATRLDETLLKMRFDIIVCDEAHKIKNRNGQAYTFLSKLSCRRRILLTGTPVQNDLMELYALVDFANPGVLGTEQEFRKEYEKPIAKYQESHSSLYEKQTGQAKALQLNNILNNFFLRRTHNVMVRYLPPRVTYLVVCKPSRLQKDLYRRLLSLNVVQDCVTGSGNCSAPLAVILALKKLCNHPNLVHPKSNAADKVEESIYYDLGKAFPQGHRHDLLRIQDSGKMKVLSTLLKNMQVIGQKVVVVSHYTQTLDILEDLCKQFDFRFKRLDGSTMAKQRQHIVDQFNNGANEFIFLLSSKAGGLGLNLQGASNIILYDIDWNPAHDIQAMSRCWRPGQKKITNIYRLITSGTIEERIFHRQIAKQDLSGSVMDLLLSNSSVKFSPQDLKDIFSFFDEDGCLTHKLIDCDCPADGLAKNLDVSGNELLIGLVNDDEDDDDFVNVKKPELPLQPPKKKMKSISNMAELHSWEHHGPPFPNLDQEGIQGAAEDVKFVFCSRSLPAPEETD